MTGHASTSESVLQSVLGNTERTARVCWTSPSNIALVKYWGKHGEQLPANPSVSLTLSKAVTTTTVEYSQGDGKTQFYFHGKKNEAFAGRVQSYIDRLSADMPSLRNKAFTISSENSFPHSAGIASSASAMSALALCLVTVDYAETGKRLDDAFWRDASHFARLGSGSACRSVSGPVMLWGEAKGVQGSSDRFATEVVKVDPVFRTFRDAILIIDSGEKSVSSSAGHGLMQGHPFAPARFDQAMGNLAEILRAIEEGDLEHFGEIVECEAFTLHAMMMTSSPSYVLMRPGTLSVIEKLKEFRLDTGTPVFMTLDAGPNIHLLYPEAESTRVESWIKDELVSYCMEGQVIFDQVGNGAKPAI